MTTTAIVQLTDWQTASLTEAERTMLNECLLTWNEKLQRNIKKKQYYDMKNKLRDLGIAIPPPLKRIDTVMGWPAKAVDYLADRSIFDGFRFRDGQNEELDLILEENDFSNLYSETCPSELALSVSFMTVTKGGKGEPDVLISAYDACTAAGIWDYRKRRIKCGIAIVDVEQRQGTLWPTQLNLYTDTQVIELHRAMNGRYAVKRHPNPQGRPLIEPLRFRPSLDRPFGRSRINRAVMAITDSAVREALRSEVAAEFAAAPQKYILGADDDIFEKKSKWEAYIGSFMALTVNEDGDMPSFGQLPQPSMQPHTEYMRDLAARFSGETSIPISSLGVIHDNPASAEAMLAAREDLVVEAEKMNKVNGTALKNVAKLVLAISQNKTLADLDDNERTITTSFKNPAMPSAVSQSDAIIKQISAMPWLANTDVVLEELGYTEDQIMRLRPDRERYEAQAVLDAVRMQQQQNPQAPNLQRMASQRPRSGDAGAGNTD